MTGGPLRARRAWLARALAATGAVAGVTGLAGCEPPPEPLRLGAQVFPGYELMFLARHLRHLSEQQVRLIEMPSASASLRALASGALEGACLTLDEVLLARSRGVPLTAVLVLDVSMGADALLGRPSVRELKGLRGLRIGVETSAVGAVMLDAALQAAGLQLGDVQPVALAFDEHERAFKAGRVDAVVTYEPVKQRLLGAGAQVLFSSRDVPGLVTDVLAVRSAFLQTHADAVAQAVSGHLAARAAFLADPARHAAAMAPRLGLAAAEVPQAFGELELPDLARNRQLLSGADGLRASAQRLHAVMLRAGLLEGRFELDGLIDARFVGARP